MKLCDACGSPNANIGMGGAMICRQCDPEIRAEMDKLRSEGKPVNVMHVAKRLFRETQHDGGNYLLRDVPEELWQRAKHRAVDDGNSLRDLVLLAITKYLE